MSADFSAFLQNAAHVQGNLPFEWETDPASGEHIVSVSAEDGKKILDWYACGNSRCLADFGGICRPKCPVCGFDHRVESPDKFMVPAPTAWVEHMKAREEALANPNGTRRPQRTIEEVFYNVRNNPDVEQTTLKKLGPSKWGRGRS